MLDLRKDQDTKRYAQALTVIPQDISVYRATMKIGKQEVGSSCYCVVDGRMRLVRGLEQIPAAIYKIRSMAE